METPPAHVRSNIRSGDFRLKISDSGIHGQDGGSDWP
jgi:hypothetical protein